MKMNYVPHHNLNMGSRKNGVPLQVKIVAGIAVVLAILHFLAPGLLSSILTPLFRPFWDMQRQATSGNGISVQALTFKKDFLLKENEELKALLGRTVASHFTLAQILKKPPFSAYDIFIIDIGADKGVKKGDGVYVSLDTVGNIAIGNIIEVNPTISRVRLYSSAGEKFDIFIGASHIEATATGKGGGTFEVVLPRDAKVVKGDAVSIPSLTDSFVGIVEENISDPSDPFATFLFRQPLNIYELKWVLVEKSNAENK